MLELAVQINTPEYLSDDPFGRLVISSNIFHGDKLIHVGFLSRGFD